MSKEKSPPPTSTKQPPSPTAARTSTLWTVLPLLIAAALAALLVFARPPFVADLSRGSVMMGTQQNSHGGAFAITSEMSTLGQTLQSLRQKKGHFEGGEEFIKDVDGFNGEKHRTMKELQKLLGVPGTPAQNVMQVMGKPDEVTRQGAEGFPELMPGPTVPAGAGTTDAGDGLYLIYFWRGRHDYLYFLTDASEKVTKCDWYMAGE